MNEELNCMGDYGNHLECKNCLVKASCKSISTKRCNKLKNQRKIEESATFFVQILHKLDTQLKIYEGKAHKSYIDLFEVRRMMVKLDNEIRNRINESNKKLDLEHGEAQSEPEHKEQDELTKQIKDEKKRELANEYKTLEEENE